MSFISGTVLDAREGAVLSGTVIDLYAEDIVTGGYGEASSDEHGRYVIDPIDPGSDYVLVAQGAGYSYRYFESLTVPAQGLMHNVGLAKLGAVSGTVVASDSGIPPVGVSAAIYLSQASEPGLALLEAATDVSGNFHINNIQVSSLDNPLGSNYNILVVPQTYSYAIDERFVPAHYEDQDVVPLRYVVQPKGIVRGNVTSAGAPLAGATVQLYENLSGLLLDTQPVLTDSGGSFEVYVNAPADYRVAIQGRGTQVADLVVSVAPGSVTSVPVVEVAGPGSIVGRVTDLNSQPVAGATVELLFEDGRGPAAESAVSSQAGTYGFDFAVPNLRYVICANAPQAQVYTQFPIATGLTVSSGQVTSAPDLQVDTIAPAGRITAPNDGASVYGSVNVAVEASDNQAIASISLVVDGEEAGSYTISSASNPASWRQQASTSFVWDSSSAGEGSHVLSINVDDLTGNRYSRSITVTVRSSTVTV